MAGIQMNRTAAGVVLPKELSSDIWADAQNASAVMRFANRIELPGAGLQIPMITGDPAASWVNETDEIAVGESTLSSKSITGYKLGVIEVFSNEFRRDLPGLYAELARRLPGALATKFDSTVFHATTAPGADFDLLSAADPLTLDATNTYDDIVAIDAAVAAANGNLNGYVLAPKARGTLLSAKDTTGRPLLINDIQRQGGVSQLLGVDVALSTAVYKADAAGDDGEVIGFAGDWSNAYYGVVEGIEVAISNEATVNKGGTQVNLFQRDMFALKATVHLGFAVRDLSKFVKITSGVDAIA